MLSCSLRFSKSFGHIEHALLVQHFALGHSATRSTSSDGISSHGQSTRMSCEVNTPSNQGRMSRGHSALTCGNKRLTSAFQTLVSSSGHQALSDFLFQPPRKRGEDMYPIPLYHNISLCLKKRRRCASWRNFGFLRSSLTSHVSY